MDLFFRLTEHVCATNVINNVFINVVIILKIRIEIDEQFIPPQLESVSTSVNWD